MGFRIRFEVLKTKIPSLGVARHPTDALDCRQVNPTFAKWGVLVGVCHHAFALVSSKPPACTSTGRLVNLLLSIWTAVVTCLVPALLLLSLERPKESYHFVLAQVWQNWPAFHWAPASICFFFTSRGAEQLAAFILGRGFFEDLTRCSTEDERRVSLDRVSDYDPA